MKAAVSLTLVLAMMTSALPASAQERIDTRTEAPIQLAIAREAARLAAEPALIGSQPEASTNAAWARVSQLAPGTGIIVMIRGEQDLNGRFVSADDVTVTIADISGAVHKATRTDVFQIRREPSFMRRHPGPTGALIGTAVGIALVALAFQRSRVGYQCQLECGLIPSAFAGGAGLGAGIGAAVGSSIGGLTHSKREEVIYREP
jgi:hypothetical protein